MKTPLLQVKNLKKYFPVKNEFIIGKSQYLKAVDNLSFEVHKGETLGLVGESGCGKSTTGKIIANLLSPTEGDILFEGKSILSLNNAQLKGMRKNIQFIFQDPYNSLNPRMSIKKIIEEPLRINKLVETSQIDIRVSRLLDNVGLASDSKNRYPHELSGGQRQRVGIARALAMNPKFIVCDEAVSALDVSVQAQVLNLLNDLQKEFELTYLFIAHGLNVVKHISSKVGVMYLGKLVEFGAVEEVYSNPKHPYTKALLSSIPSFNKEKKKDRIILKGEIPSPINPPTGCNFHTRCGYCMEKCKNSIPLMRILENNHKVACHLYEK